MKHAVVAVLFVLAVAWLAPPAPADESADQPAGAVAPPVALEDVVLLPIHEVEWGVLLQEHPKLVERLMLLGKRIQRVYGHLQAREDKADAGSRALREEIERLSQRIAPDLERVLELAEGFGIDAEVLDVLDHAPRGPRRLERHVVRLVLALPDLTPRQRAIHERLVPAVEGALLALDGEDETRIGALLVRFWRAVDATLDREQRAALRRRLPTKAAKYADLLGHVFTLEGLTIEQATRLRSLLVRFEQEAAPDQGRDAPDARRRMVALGVDVWREGQSILTPAQRAELAAVPPRLTAKDRPGDLEHDFADVAFTPDQIPALQSLRRRYGPLKGIVGRRLAALEREAGALGEDSPQREAMEARRAAIYGDALRQARQAARELFRYVLTTEQILLWVLGRAG